MASRRFAGGLGLLVWVLLAVPTAQQDATQCGRRKTGRIVGGSAAGVNSYPMVAALMKDTPMAAYCSATILSKNWAATAAHCVDKVSPNDVQLMVGSHDYSKFPDTPYSKLLRVDRFVVYPERINGNNDLGLVRTQQPIEFNAGVGPVCLPTSDDLFDRQGIVEVLGWGRTRIDEPVSPALRVTKLNVMRNTDCAYYYGSSITPYIICTFTQGRDFCFNDSGGPLLEDVNGRLTLVGIINFGTCLQGKPGGSLRVYYYTNWINSIIRN